MKLKQLEVAGIASGTYVAVRPTPNTKGLLLRIQRMIDIYNNVEGISPHDLHCTILYSPAIIPPKDAAYIVNPSKTYSAKMYSFELFGPPGEEDTLVLKLESEKLRRRQADWLRMGGESTYDEYQPHVSLFKLDDPVLMRTLLMRARRLFDEDYMGEQFEELKELDLLFTDEYQEPIKDF